MAKLTSEEYCSNNWLEEYKHELKDNYTKILNKRAEISLALDRESCDRWRIPLKNLTIKDAQYFDFDDDIVKIGKKDELKDNQSDELLEALKSFIPWRKGPFNYYDNFIDSEWKSNLKWDRVEEVMPDLEGKRICDVGSNNDYYLFRMLQHNPRLVYGIDPMVRYYFQNRMNKQFIPDNRMQFDLFGVDELDMFPNFFDIVFFMGIIYHRRNPIQTLSTVAKSMKSGGTIIVESCGIPGDDPYCLFPESRYLKAPGYWFLPSWKALENMLNRTGFKEIHTFANFKLELEEQRWTPWVEFHSLEQFLDENDHDLTAEGYPAPTRIYIIAKKK